jgi:hypothetical protein
MYPYSSPECGLSLVDNPPDDTAVHCNTLYLLNLNLVRNELKLTLVDTLKLESVVEVGKGAKKEVHCEYEQAANYVKQFGRIGDERSQKTPDLISSLMFLEAKTTNYLVCLSKESSRFGVYNIEKDCLHEICLNAHFGDKFKDGGVKLIQGGWDGQRGYENMRNSVRSRGDGERNMVDGERILYVCGNDGSIFRMEFLA